MQASIGRSSTRFTTVLRTSTRKGDEHMSSPGCSDSNTSPGYEFQIPGEAPVSYVPGQLGNTSSFPDKGGSVSQDDAWGVDYESAPSERHDDLIAPWLLFAMRFFAVLPITLAFILIYDNFLAQSVPDRVVVTGMNSRYRPRTGRSYTVEATGSRPYKNSVSRQFYRQLQIGDTLRVEASPIMGVWRDANVVGNGRADEYHSNEPLLMGIAAFFMLAASATAFAEPHVILLWNRMLWLIGLAELLSAFFLVYGGLKWAGCF